MTPLRIIDERETEDFVPEYLLRPITATEGGVWIPVSEIDPDDLEPLSRAAFWQAVVFDTLMRSGDRNSSKMPSVTVE